MEVLLAYLFTFQNDPIAICKHARQLLKFTNSHFKICCLQIY